jgi:hypothetical protein
MTPTSPTDYYGQFLMMVQTIVLAYKDTFRDKVHEAGIVKRPGVRVELDVLSGAMDVDPECLRYQREDKGESIYYLADTFVWWYMKVFTQAKNNQWEEYTRKDWMKDRPKWLVTIQDRKEKEEKEKKSKLKKSIKKRRAKSKW